MKGAYLVTEPCFDAGERHIPLLEVQRLRGNATYWQAVQPALRPELGAIDALLAQARPGEPYVCPKGDERRVEEACLEFWDA